jgi:hypothetical protein
VKLVIAIVSVILLVAVIVASCRYEAAQRQDPTPVSRQTSRTPSANATGQATWGTGVRVAIPGLNATATVLAAPVIASAPTAIPSAAAIVSPSAVTPIAAVATGQPTRPVTATVASGGTAVPTRPAVTPTAMALVYAVVNTTDDLPISIRRDPANPDSRIRSWPGGSRMTGIGPDRQAEGRTWKNVRDPDGNVGWMAADFLVPAR